MVVNKYDTNGNLIWNLSIPNPNSADNHDPSYRATGLVFNAGSVYISAYNTQQGNCDGVLFKINEPGTITSLEQNNIENSLIISPNPSCCVFNINYRQEGLDGALLRLWDATGKCLLIQKESGFGDQMNKQLDLSSFSKGIYVLEIISNNKRETRKLVVE